LSALGTERPRLVGRATGRVVGIELACRTQLYAVTKSDRLILAEKQSLGFSYSGSLDDLPALRLSTGIFINQVFQK